MTTFTVTLTHGDPVTVQSRYVCAIGDQVQFFDTTHHDAHARFDVANVLRIDRQVDKPERRL